MNIPHIKSCFLNYFAQFMLGVIRKVNIIDRYRASALGGGRGLILLTLPSPTKKNQINSNLREISKDLL